jgi:hypothetical protein
VKVRALAMILPLLLLVSCSRLPGNERAETVVAQDCFDAVKKVLGTDGQVAKYGHLVGQKSVEVVAYTRIKKFKQNSEGVPISKLVVLQKNNSHWDVVLNVSKEIKNPFGYIGLDYIDDSQDYPGFRVSFSDHRSDGVRAFVILLFYIGTNGEIEGIPTEVSWNGMVARFQEFSVNEAPEGFKPELKNPPHIKNKK